MNLLLLLGLTFPAISNAEIKKQEYKYKKGVSKAHLSYLKELLQFQQERQNTIEGKTSQLVGQSSVVFSLVALFIPLFYDKLIDQSIWIKLTLIFLFLATFAFYLFAILHSARTLAIHNYKYATGTTGTVLGDLSSKEFIQEQVSDLIYAVELASHANNQKGTNLILAHQTFRSGNITFAGLALSVS